MWGTLELPLSSSLCGFPLPSTAAHTRKHSHTLSVKAQSRIREMKTLDDTEFTRVESAVISRSSDALVLGSLLPYYYGKAVGGVADCFIVCAASMDCAAFMDNLRTETCSFKGPGGRVHEKRPGIDVYIRRQSTPLSLPTYRPVTPSRHRRHHLHGPRCRPAIPSSRANFVSHGSPAARARGTVLRRWCCTAQ